VIRKDLFTGLVNSAVNSPSPRTNLRRLFSLPLTPVEKEMLTDHLKSVKDDGLARELLLMWHIQCVDVSEARTIVQGDSGRADEKRRIIRDGLEKTRIGI